MGSKAGRLIVGVAAIAGGVVLGVFHQWNLALAAVSFGVSVISDPQGGVPAGLLNDQQGVVLENRVGALDYLPVIYGTARVAGVLADVRVDPNSTNRKRLVMVSAFCHGSRDGSDVAGIDYIYFDDRLAVSFASVQSPFSQTPAGETLRFLEFTKHLGSTAQTVDTSLNTYFPTEWPSTAAGAGVCYTRFTLFYDPDIYAGGIPTIQAVIRGNKVYDPRDSTWKHSTNPALCIRDYILSSIYGLGIAESQLDDDSFSDMANYCDELVTLPDSTTQPRFELNGVVDTGRTVEENLAALCTACRGQVINEGDKWRLIIRRQRTPIDGFKLTPQNTVDGSWQFILPGADTAPNVARITYIEPARNYDTDVVQWPEPGFTNPYLDEDNSYENRLEMDLPYTDNRLRAQQLGMTLLKEARVAVGAVCTLREEALRLRVGDVVYVTQPTPGWVDETFDVVALAASPDGTVKAILALYDDTVYDLDTQYVQPDVISTSLPDPFTCPEPASLVLTVNSQALQTNDGRYIPRIRVTWDKPDDPFIEYLEVQAKKDADSEWDTYGRVPALEDASFYVVPVTDETWDVRIRAVNHIGVKSAWVSDSIIVVTDDPRPQILSITLVPAHADTHSDVAHADVAHADSAYSDSHSDVAHGDSHLDMHTDTHTDSHSDTHSDVHGDGDAHMDSHSDSHGDVTHGDATASDHGDTAHTDSHTDTGHGDTAHSDSHTDAHSDGQFGVGVALQADKDSASVRAVARKHGDVAHDDHTDGAHTDVAHTDVTDPTEAEVRAQPASDGRNVVIELIDVATGAQVLKAPGDQIRVGAIAYSATGGGGVEGPLALASETLFNVAPVGADLWVES